MLDTVALHKYESTGLWAASGVLRSVVDIVQQKPTTFARTQIDNAASERAVIYCQAYVVQAPQWTSSRPGTPAHYWTS